MTRWLWLSAGFVCVVLGGIGVIVPGLPTTGFLVLAAGCFSRSSPRFEQWVLNLPKFGPLVRDYRAGLGMPVRAKAFAIGSIVVFAGGAALFALSGAWRWIVVALGVVGIAYIGWRIPTQGRNRPTDSQ